MVKSLLFTTVMFSFTFKLAVPGLANPFSPSSPSPSSVASTSSLSQTSASDGAIKAERLTTGSGRVLSRRQRPRSNSPAPAPLTRKRGWEPSYPEPSLSTTTLASSSGYLDTPAKYRDLAHLTPDEIRAMTEGALSACQTHFYLFRCMCFPCGINASRESGFCSCLHVCACLWRVVHPIS